MLQDMTTAGWKHTKKALVGSDDVYALFWKHHALNSSYTCEVRTSVVTAETTREYHQQQGS